MTALSSHKTGTLPYPVLFGRAIWHEGAEVIKSLKSSGQMFLLADENTSRHCLPFLDRWIPGLSESSVLVIPAGESSKEITFVEKIWKWLMDHRAGRTDLLINLGGGVVSDLGGFAAGTYKRGIRYVNIPTSLIGQADAAIGGKTGINVSGIKNQAGLFYDPSAVLIDPAFLKTLPEKEMISGYGELIKSAFLSGGGFWNMIRQGNAFQRDSIPELIRLAIHFKCDVVALDPLELNRRKILNFGHTVGHAFESLSGQDDSWDLSHGEAVAAGMICEGFLSFRLAGLSRQLLDELVSLTRSSFRFQKISPERYPDIAEIIAHDKKQSKGRPGFVLMESAGKPALEFPVSKELLEESLDFYNQTVMV